MASLSNFNVGYLLRGQIDEKNQYRIWLIPPNEPKGEWKKADKPKWRKRPVVLEQIDTQSIKQLTHHFFNKDPTFNVKYSQDKKLVVSLNSSNQNFKYKPTINIVVSGTEKGQNYEIRINPVEMQQSTVLINKATSKPELGPLANMNFERLKREMPLLQLKYTVSLKINMNSNLIKIVEKSISNAEYYLFANKPQPLLHEIKVSGNVSSEISRSRIKQCPPNKPFQALSLRRLRQEANKNELYLNSSTSFMPFNIPILVIKRIALCSNSEGAFERAGGFLSKIAIELIQLGPLTDNEIVNVCELIDVLDLIDIFNLLTIYAKTILGSSSNLTFTTFAQMVNRSYAVIYQRVSLNYPCSLKEADSSISLVEMNKVLWETLEKIAKRMNSFSNLAYFQNAMIKCAIQLLEILTMDPFPLNFKESAIKESCLKMIVNSGSQGTNSFLTTRFFIEYAKEISNLSNIIFTGFQRPLSLLKTLVNGQDNMPFLEPWKWNLIDESPNHLAKFHPNLLAKDWLFALFSVRVLIYCETSEKFSHLIKGIHEKPKDVKDAIAIDHPTFLMGCYELASEIIHSSNAKEIIKNRAMNLIESLTNGVLKNNEFNVNYKKIYSSILSDFTNLELYPNLHITPDYRSQKVDIFSARKYKNDTLAIFNNLLITQSFVKTTPEEIFTYVALKGKDSDFGRSIPLSDHLEAFLTDNKSILILQGDRGCGKSLSMRILVKDLFENYLNGSFLPIISSFRNSSDTFETLIKNLSQFIIIDGSHRHILKNLRILWIFDGFDDVSFIQEEKVPDLNDLNKVLELYPQSKCIFICRNEPPAFRNFNFSPNPKVQTVSIEPFDETQASSLITKYLDFMVNEDSHEKEQEYEQHSHKVSSIQLFNQACQLEWRAISTNPFLLKNSIEFLPSMITKDLIDSIDIQMITRKLFDKLAIALITYAYNKSPNVTSSVDFINYAAELAHTMEIHNISSIPFPLSQEHMDIFGEFFEKKNECLYRQMLVFHKSSWSFLNEYFRDYFTSLWQDPDALNLILDQIDNSTLAISNYF